MKPLWVMIAGPYTSGARSEEDRAENLCALNAVAYEVFRRGHVPIVGVNLALRIGGASAGADEEVERIRSRGGRVYDSVEEIP